MQWRSGRRVGGEGGAPPEHSPAPTPSRAVYGYLLYLLGQVGLLVYLVWLLVPAPLLLRLGLDFFPQPYWAVALPIYLAVLFVVFVLVVYPALGLLVLTPLHRTGENFRDRHSIEKADAKKCDKADMIPPVYDMPLEEVMDHLRKESGK